MISFFHYRKHSLPIPEEDSADKQENIFESSLSLNKFKVCLVSFKYIVMVEYQ